MSQTRSNLVQCAILAGALAGSGTPAPAADPEFCVSCTAPQARYRCSFSGDAHNMPKGGLQLYCITMLAREGGHQSCAVDRQSEGPCNGTPKVIALPTDPASGGVMEDIAGPQPAMPAPDAPKASPPSATAEGRAESEPATSSTSPEGDVSAPADGNKTWNNKSGAPANPSEQTEDTGQKSSESPGVGETVAGPVIKAGEAVSEAAKSTGKVLENAGSAVGHAAKKTWKCLTTLFGDC